MKTLLWKVRATYHAHRKLGISWSHAWYIAGVWIGDQWHLDMTPKEAAQEEAWAWADC